MAAPSARNDQLMSEVTSGDEPTTNEEEFKDNDMILDNDPMDVDAEVSDTSMAELENDSVPNEVGSENASSTNSISTSGQLGFLSLPAELRVMIYRHLLVESRPLSMYWPGRNYRPFPAVLGTCSLVRREAFQVLLGENIFHIGFLHPTRSNPQINDTIRNVHLDLRLNATTARASRIARARIIHVVREFGSPAITRGTLHIIFRVGIGTNDLVFWTRQCLPRFTNFRTIQIEYVPHSAHSHLGYAKWLCSVYWDFHKYSLTPFFGPALQFTTEHSLLFRPQKHLNSLPPKGDVDWMDFLDGIRLGWNYDSPTKR